jgi:hypothetical protein
MVMMEIDGYGEGGTIPMTMMGSFPAIPALATTMSILWFGECANAALKAESCSDQILTSHLTN